ncbi:MAG: toll/interleukin-1 receptor domain-containing protein, partial [Chloroflexi bacterium]|nr:toll/interleukin-1 receptor domain-containing protein [Chloroflexota bacterium]
MDDIAYHDIFCIYHPDDIVFVRRLAAQMRASGINCWFDDSDFGKLSAESAQLKAGILQAYTVAIVLSQSSAESQLCNELIQYAVSHSKRIITLIHHDDIRVEVHPAIVNNSYLFCREQDNLVERIEQLRPRLEVDDNLRLHTKLLVAAERWRSSGRNREHLLPAQSWEAARRWLAGAHQNQSQPSPPQVDIIQSTRARRKSGGRQRN